MNTIYDLNQNQPTDESTISYEVHEYNPITGTDLNRAGEIRIVIQNQDLFLYPSDSYLQISGQLVKNQNNVAYENANDITLVNNALMHLFSKIDYSLNGREIDSVFHPGQATTMVNMLKFPEDKDVDCWIKDHDKATTANANVGFKKRQDLIIKNPNPKGSFTFKIPLKSIFGFCEDYEKVIYGFEHKLTLTKKGTTDDAIFRVDAVDEGKVHLESVSWFIPHVTPSDVTKNALYHNIEAKKSFPVSYRRIICDTISVPRSTHFSWTLSSQASPDSPRYVIIGFQTDLEANQTKNTSIFHNLNVSDMYVMINSKKFPEHNHDIDFSKMKIARIYDDADSFREKYYGIEKIVKKFNISLKEFGDIYPLFVFDVSKRSEKMKLTSCDIIVKTVFREAPGAHTQAFAAVISDRYVEFKSDGNKLQVVT